MKMTSPTWSERFFRLDKLGRNRQDNYIDIDLTVALLTQHISYAARWHVYDA